jgi:uncharacterized protein DUF4331
MNSRRSHIVLSLAFLSLAAVPAHASSHREAPNVTRHPKVDATDFYMFDSYEAGRSGFVTLIANYSPFQTPYGGPNFFFMDPDALYEIHVDHDGDAVEDLTFQFRFTDTLRDLTLPIGSPGQTQDVAVPLLNVDTVTAADDSAQNVVETFTVTLVRGDRRTGQAIPITNANGGGATFRRPLDRIGDKSIPDYEAYARSFVYTIALPDGQTGRMFVGQRKDPFVANLGEAFDLINVENPIGPPNVERNSLDDDNVTSLVLELPASFLASSPSSPVIGAWTTASLRQARVSNPQPTFSKPSVEGGAWTQVSRLGSPLVNELVIGMRDKDRFNASKPRDDAQFATYVTHPTFPAIVERVFGSAGVRAPTNFPRTDLVQAFLTGIPGLNQTTPAVAEMLRLDTSRAPVPAASQSPLGVLGGDLAGFPNGRRPGDDVIDIILRVAMGALVYPTNPALAPSGNLPFTDGAEENAQMFMDVFPYLRTPVAESVVSKAK